MSSKSFRRLDVEDKLKTYILVDQGKKNSSLAVGCHRISRQYPLMSPHQSTSKYLRQPLHETPRRFVNVAINTVSWVSRGEPRVKKSAISAQNVAAVLFESKFLSPPQGPRYLSRCFLQIFPCLHPTFRSRNTFIRSAVLTGPSVPLPRRLPLPQRRLFVRTLLLLRRFRTELSDILPVTYHATMFFLLQHGYKPRTSTLRLVLGSVSREISLLCRKGESLGIFARWYCPFKSWRPGTASAPPA